MKVVIFGATGMVGQGVLRECLRDADVTKVLTIGRAATGQLDPRLHELVRSDLTQYAGLDDELSGYDACFFCLGVSSVGMKEGDYSRITYDLTLAAASVLARLNPAMTFVYVSGSGTDSSEQGRVMWARVKGRTENALRRLPFKAVYLFRPGVIQPLHGVRSKTRLYHVFYVLLAPLLSTARRLFPAQVQTTESLGRAMLAVARHGAPGAVLEPADLNALAQDRTASA
ncbi:epimerase [Paraburkholderia acidicola]|uniref:Epimerase n=1 Tax=Paraburkholderia acidicola TaxID=1912599 RepID=A0A2A4EQL7_9BURK|nr:NAD-dependent epimerase/dehydratase family protein [Paraburkholderia acidicola]PCE22456.1 epimerase [Paraburkholderia acidicola]